MSRSLPSMTWTIVVLYVAVCVLRPAGLIPANLNAPLSALLPLAFAVIHGSRQYGWRGILAFAVICLVVSNTFENVSILTGFPFGHYHYSDDLGPKFFLVPMLIGSAYLGMGYVSWTVARLMLDGIRPAADRILALPALASFVMVSWDLTFDPAASTIGHSWIWQDGGAYFGVPVSNFLGWYLTVFVFFQLFALYQSRRLTAHSQSAASEATSKPSFWWPALAMYAATALRPVMTLLFLPAGAATITDQAGVIWNVEALYGVCALAGIFTMGAFSMLALLRLTERFRGVRGTDRVPAQADFSRADHFIDMAASARASTSPAPTSASTHGSCHPSLN